ncbi:MAG: omptin family outer membrane protease [Treponema sp.]|nr:omptin family outer membrane protease [Candidatus Treponema caballi]
MKRLVSVLILLLCAAGVWAETSFSIGPVLNWSWADIREYVITYPSFEKLSELDWDAHNVWQYGVKTELTHNRFVFTGDIMMAAETESGLMQDYDWFYLLVNNPDHPTDMFTEFSEHEITLYQKNLINLTAGWKVVNRKNFALTLGGSFQYLKTYLKGHDGYVQHSCYDDRNDVGYTNQNVSPYDPDRTKYPVSGPAIWYQQEIESLWFDVRTDFILSSVFTLSAEAGISPWQIYDCDDYHYYMGSTQYVWYYDKPKSTLMYRGLLSVSWNFGKRSSLILSGDVQYLPYADGNSYKHTSADSLYQYAQLGATDYLGWDVSLSYRIRIF